MNNGITISLANFRKNYGEVLVILSANKDEKYLKSCINNTLNQIYF